MDELRRNHDESASERVVTSDELTEVLRRLEALERHGSYEFDCVTSDDTTVEAIVEATGVDEKTVERVLNEIRDIQVQSRIGQALREMEEPMYRVERPGNPPHDPLARTNTSEHLRTVQSFLDHLPRPEAKTIKIRRKTEKHVEDKASAYVGYVIMAGLVFFITFVVAYGLWRLFER